MRPLQEYDKKRNFRKTPEPSGKLKRSKKEQLIFVIQEHHASHLHYDFRLEWEGVLKSWSVPKGPSLDPATKRLAVEVEDHPIEYAKFHGTIPKGEYGGGEVFIWDKGTWIPKGDPAEGLKKGRLEFTLKGERLHGDWVLIRTKRPGVSKPQWLLIKRTDEYAEEGNVAEVIGGEEAAREESVRTKPKKKVVPVKKVGKASKVSKSTVPEFIPPQLAQLVSEPPVGENWAHEAKFDGYRIQAHVNGSEVRLMTRAGNDWTEKYEPIVKALKKLKVKQAIFDGEVVLLNEEGKSDFQRLQNVMSQKELSSLTYYVFDLLYLNGEDLRPKMLSERKDILQNVLKPLKKSQVLFSEHFDVEGDSFLQASCDLNLEGIISKRLDMPYISGRAESWVKSKCKLRQEFVIGGYTEGQGLRKKEFGSLLLGVYEGGSLRYVGKVGTGFDKKLLQNMMKKVKALETKTSPFEIKEPRGKGIHWVKPELVAEIAFAQWTKDKILRVPVFQGLREDKPAEQIHAEKPKQVKSKSKSDLPITSPDKVLYPEEGITKEDLARYYQEVAIYMLPHVMNRPLTLVRCPEGKAKACFFQKHYSKGTSEDIHAVYVKEKKGKEPYMAIDTDSGLTALVQMGAMEIHTWGSREDKIEYPDQFVLDFDPAPNVPWDKVIEGVLEAKELLDDLDLIGFLKTTGGKGIHIQVPMEPIYDWDQIKDFTHTLAMELVSRFPDLFIEKMSKSERTSKIFVDYLRNARGATAVAPYSLRAKDISAVAMPIEWKELGFLKSANQFTLREALKKIESRKADPWKDYFKTKQKIGILKPSKN
jgi:bifunctional non-homologous end joining protein LigD